MTQSLIRYLQIAAEEPGSGQRRKLIEKLEAKPIRELLLTTDIESATLVQEEVLKTVWDGAEPFRCFRDALPIIRIKGNSARLVYGEAGTYADRITEGAEIPINVQDYSARTYTVKKLAVRPLISNEMVADGLFDTVNLEVEKAGKRIENAFNRDCLITIMDNIDSGNTVDVATAPQDTADIADAIGFVTGDNFVPDTLILHPIAEAETLKDANLVYLNTTNPDFWKTGRLGGTILGLRPFRCSVSTAATGTWAAGSQTWGGADGNYQALVYDSKNMGAIALREDISIEQYKDPVRDLTGITVKMRYDVQYIHTTAGCDIQAA